MTFGERFGRQFRDIARRTVRVAAVEITTVRGRSRGVDLTELIGEDTWDKMSAARKKGKWVGGCPVLGYDITHGITQPVSSPSLLSDILKKWRRGL